MKRSLANAFVAVAFWFAFAAFSGCTSSPAPVQRAECQACKREPSAEYAPATTQRPKVRVPASRRTD